MQIRNYCETDVPTMVRIWNEVVAVTLQMQAIMGV